MKHLDTQLKLTKKEEGIIQLFWDNGLMFVKDLIELYPEPKPHFNTISTLVRSLEAKGFISHTAFGNTYQYFASITPKEYAKRGISNIVSNFFSNSYKDVIFSLVKDEKITPEELAKILEEIKK